MSNALYHRTIWEGRRCNCIGMPWTFTKYTLTENKLIFQDGLLNQTTHPIFIDSLRDATLKRNAWQRIIGTGDIILTKSMKIIDSDNESMKNIKDPKWVFNHILDMIEKSRNNHIHIT